MRDNELHRWAASHYVETGEHRCVCGFKADSNREDVSKRAIGTHAPAANKKERK